jgi:hypothetical protein
MSNSDKHVHLSRLAVERYVLGEMSEAEMAALKSVAAQCETCGELLADTEADEKAFAMLPVPAEIRKLWTSPERRGLFDGWFARVAVAVPVAAAVVVAVIFLTGGPSHDSRSTELFPGWNDKRLDENINLMGSPKKAGGDRASQGLNLGFYLRSDDGKTMGASGQKLKEGDSIQFWYDLPVDLPVVMVGIDGRGSVTTYLPGRDGKDLTIELDDAVGVERFFLCSGKGVGVDKVFGAAKALVESGANLRQIDRLPLTCEQASVWIIKE